MASALIEEMGAASKQTLPSPSEEISSPMLFRVVESTMPRATEQHRYGAGSASATLPVSLDETAHQHQLDENEVGLLLLCSSRGHAAC